VSTRVQSATLSAVAPADGGPTNYGGSVQFASADTQDRPELSTTADLRKDENTLVTLAGGLRAQQHVTA
jgi:hypothetical protein